MVDTIVRLGSNCGDCLPKAIASQLMTEGSQNLLFEISISDQGNKNNRLAAQRAACRALNTCESTEALTDMTNYPGF